MIEEVHTTCTAMGFDATKKTIHSLVLIGLICQLIPAGLPIPVATLTPCRGSLPVASDRGTCWSGQRKRLPECGLVSSFFLACPTAHIGYRLNYPQRLERETPHHLSGCGGFRGVGRPPYQPHTVNHSDRACVRRFLWSLSDIRSPVHDPALPLAANSRRARSLFVMTD